MKLELNLDTSQKSYIYTTGDGSFNQQLEDRQQRLLEENQKLEEEKVRIQKEIYEAKNSLKQEVLVHKRS